MMPSITITWRIADAGACPICKELDGWTWTFTDEPVPQELSHPEFGVVWSRTQGSMAHEHGAKKTCRCHWDSEVDASDAYSQIKLFCEEVHQMLQTREAET